MLGCTDEADDDDEEGFVEEVDIIDTPDVDDLEPYAAGTVNNSADFLVVYNNNIENMLPTSCNGPDWNKLFAYIKAQTKSPDIFIVQQISNSTQLKALTTRMTNELAGTYASVIAIASPGSMGYDSVCGKKKNQQTNAIIYRTDRFTYEATTRWRSDAPDNWKAGTGGCKNLDDTPTSQDRVENVAIRLYDRVAKQKVTAAAIHWPTNTWHGPECADENIREANSAVDSLGGTLKIIAGDANATKGAQGWWNDAIALGFRDPIAETCPSSGCPDSTSTNGDRRIDFMLVKSGHGFSGARTINESSTGGKYSDHRALRADVRY
ncbi:MAG: hypothetical protein ABI867_24145 [Kofleriaceae bacterium]